MSRFTNPVPQYFLDDGTLASAGRMKFYVNKDYSTLKDTYSQPDNTVPNTNPLSLDGHGRMPPCFGEGLYSVKFYAYDPAQPNNLGTLQWTRDDVTLSELTGQFADWSGLLTYNIGDIVKASDSFYYRSFTASNRGNDPASSPTKWEKIVFFTVYNPNVTYQVDNNVTNAGLLYRCNTANTIGVAPPAAQWDNLTFNGVVSGNLSVSGNVTIVGTLSFLGVLQPSVVYAKKTADQSVISSTAYVDATGMTVNLDNGIDYHVVAHILWKNGGSTTNGIRCLFTGGNIVSFMWTANTNSGTNSAPVSLGSSSAVIPSGDFHKLPANANVLPTEVIIYDAIVTGAGTPFKLQFAQEASVAVNTTIIAKSCMIATRMA